MQLKKDLAARKAAVLLLTEKISEQAVALIERYALADGLQLADALIAATALTHGLPLATGNTKHFQVVEGSGSYRLRHRVHGVTPYLPAESCGADDKKAGLIRTTKKIR